MTTVTVMPRAGDWTVDHLDRLPDDGLQYELIDGILLVSPAPVPGHQSVAVGLVVLLHRVCPPHLQVFVSPIDFRPDEATSVQPDVAVVRRGEVGEQNLVLPPLLVVEVLSPSTRRKDLVLKHSLYADAGVESYWTVDPETPSIICWDLVDGGYVEVARAVATERVTVGRPYRVTLCPTELVRG
ncbi:Uma2 family endonuclease [soil metagenome]